MPKWAIRYLSVISLLEQTAHDIRMLEYPADVSQTPEKLQRHIEVLSEFEQKYGEFLNALHNQWAGRSSGWSEAEFASRRRELQLLAPRADQAMEASGVGQLVITYPPAMGGGVKSTDLPSQIFDFSPAYFDDDGMDIQRAILDRIPSQIAGLHMRLEEIEEVGTERKPSVKPLSPRTRSRWRVLLNHPWFVTIAGGLVVIGLGVVIQRVA